MADQIKTISTVAIVENGICENPSTSDTLESDLIPYQVINQDKHSITVLEKAIERDEDDDDDDIDEEINNHNSDTDEEVKIHNSDTNEEDYNHTSDTDEEVNCDTDEEVNCDTNEEINSETDEEILNLNSDDDEDDNVNVRFITPTMDPVTVVHIMSDTDDETDSSDDEESLRPNIERLKTTRREVQELIQKELARKKESAAQQASVGVFGKGSMIGNITEIIRERHRQRQQQLKSLIL